MVFSAAAVLGPKPEKKVVRTRRRRRRRRGDVLCNQSVACAEAAAGTSLAEINDEEEEGGRPWSSLPVLVLWMVKDRLDIFDNWRVAGVCRDWRSASAGYPKSLQTVGDGLPWIWDMGSNNPAWSISQGFVSLARECKLRIDMPELVGSSEVLYSKQGWILLRKRGRVILERMSEDSLILVNPLTRAKIGFPILEGAPLGYYGSFTTSTDGHPHRVLIYMLKSPRIVILTARPSEQKWTEHVFLDRAITMLGIKALTAIGHKLYCDAALAGLIIFDLENHSWKKVAPLAQIVYYAELDGQLLCLPLRDPQYKTYEVYKYNDGPTSWEKLKDSEARGINWYMFDASSCIATKGGEGQMIYYLYRLNHPRGYVFVWNLKACGEAQILSLPFEITSNSYWVKIG